MTARSLSRTARRRPRGRPPPSTSAPYGCRPPALAAPTPIPAAPLCRAATVEARRTETSSASPASKTRVSRTAAARASKAIGLDHRRVAVLLRRRVVGRLATATMFSNARARHLAEPVGLELAGVGDEDRARRRPRASRRAASGNSRSKQIMAPTSTGPARVSSPGDRKSGARRQGLLGQVEAAGRGPWRSVSALAPARRRTAVTAVVRTGRRPLEERDADGHFEVRGQPRERAHPRVVARRSPAPSRSRGRRP